MSDIALRTTTAYAVTCVPDYFIDEYMVNANGEYVKIFLYLLRSISGNLNSLQVSDIADALDHTEKDVRKALHYWEKEGLLELQYDELHDLKAIKILSKPSPSPLISEVPSPAPVAPVEALPVTAVTKTPIKATTPEDDRLSEIVFFAERIMKTTLSMELIDSFIFWHETLGLSWDLVEYIIDRSVDKGSGNRNYMNKIALSYANDHVTSVEEAKLHDTNFLSVSFAVRGAFALTRSALNTEQVEYVERWIKEYGFSEELIKEACLRTYDKTNSPAFKYADAILSNWHANNVKSLEDVAVLDEKHAENSTYTTTKAKPSKPVTNNFHNFGQRNNLDFDQIEKIMQES